MILYSCKECLRLHLRPQTTGIHIMNACRLYKKYSLDAFGAIIGSVFTNAFQNLTLVECASISSTSISNSSPVIKYLKTDWTFGILTFVVVTTIAGSTNTINGMVFASPSGTNIYPTSAPTYVNVKVTESQLSVLYNTMNGSASASLMTFKV